MRISDWSSDVCSSDLHVKGCNDFPRGTQLDLFAQANAHQRVMNQSQPVAQRRADMVHKLDGRSTCTALGTVAYYEVGRTAGFKHRFGNGEPFPRMTNTEFEAHGLTTSVAHTSALLSLMRSPY